MRILQSTLIFLGRLFLSLTFILSSLYKIIDWQSTEKEIMIALIDWQNYLSQSDVIQNIFIKIFPLVPIFLIFFVALELMGGIMILLGVKTKLGSIFLILCLIPTTLIFHPFWIMEALKYEMEKLVFLKNLALLGGLFYVLVFGGQIEKKKPMISIANPDLNNDE